MSSRKKGERGGRENGKDSGAAVSPKKKSRLVREGQEKKRVCAASSPIRESSFTSKKGREASRVAQQKKKKGDPRKRRGARCPLKSKKIPHYRAGRNGKAGSRLENFSKRRTNP